jgi:hypothetical protein
MKKTILTLVTLFCSFTVAQAAEVDSFTKRYEPLEDSLSSVNEVTHTFLEKAVDDANVYAARKGRSCREKDLYKRMRNYFSNQYTGDLGEYIVVSGDLPRITTTIRESIYSDFKWFQSIIQGAYAYIKDPTAAHMKVNGVLVGTDKFEHFMGTGFIYFRRHYLRGKAIRKAIEYGNRMEGGFMGAWTTGVKAYGDLSANFNGMRFWNHVLQKRDDVLGKEYNIGPYVTCEDRKWKVVKKIDWSNYVDQSFDEGINCSEFSSHKLTKKVLFRIAELERYDELGRRYTCPVEPSLLPGLVKKYGKFSDILINTNGHQKVRRKIR